MRVPVKLLGFGFWLLSLNFAQCQECLRENIKYENTEPVEKASYPDGETVKVNCMTGYAGLYKLKCEKGEWKIIIERQCAKKRCSHPGDTPNGDFKLTEGMEFVFGATVVYTCKTGYEMRSRINQRTCRAQGWDNAVPLCEVVKCPAINTDGDVTASGNKKEGSYGDVIHFECASSDKMIVGSSEIHCKETGKWSDSVPKCKDITCTAPDIPNGKVVEQISEYKKDAILKYKCNPGFSKREEIPRCTKIGWTVKPECDVICELSATFGIKNISPKGKTIFRPGESVEITCSEKYWFFFSKETSKSFTCQDNGKWDHTPVCEDIICKAPDIPNGKVVEQMSEYKKDAILKYKCNPGFSKKEEIPRCTKIGWTVKPECDVICELSVTFGIKNINPKGKTVFRAGESVEITCSEKYWLIFTKETRKSFTCHDNGKWDHTPLCEDSRCEDPHGQHVINPYWGDLKLGEKKSYRCESGYSVTAGEATCTQDGWTPKPLCAKSCMVTVEQMNKRGIRLQWKPKEDIISTHDDGIEFACEHGKNLRGKHPLRQKCNNGVMNLPECV